MTSAAWPDNDVTTLRELWAKGLSATQIALRIPGVSRNAVLGKAHRLGLPVRRLPGGLPTSGKAQRKPAPRAPAMSAEERAARARERMQRLRASRGPVVSQAPIREAPKPPTGMRMAALIDLASNECRFPIGDPREPGFGFCGTRQFRGLPYCEYHAGLAYRAVERPPTEAPSLVGGHGDEFLAAIGAGKSPERIDLP